MTTKISVQDVGELPKVELHHLPCNIKCNDRANVATYFNPVEEEQNGKTKLSCTFRGRPLDGEIIKVPEGHLGLVLDEKRRPFSEDEDRNIDVVGKFDEFTKWHFDSKYTSISTIKQAIDSFPTISAAVHAPVQSLKSKESG